MRTDLLAADALHNFKAMVSAEGFQPEEGILDNVAPKAAGVDSDPILVPCSQSGNKLSHWTNVSAARIRSNQEALIIITSDATILSLLPLISITNNNKCIFYIILYYPASFVSD